MDNFLTKENLDRIAFRRQERIRIEFGEQYCLASHLDKIKGMNLPKSKNSSDDKDLNPWVTAMRKMLK